MIKTPAIDWFALSPVLLLLGASFAALLEAVLVPHGARRTVAGATTALGFLSGIAAAVWLYVDSADGHRVIGTAFYRDRWTALSMVIVCAIGLAAVGASWGERMARSHVAEYYALLAAAGAGMAFFVGAGNLMTLFLSLEWFSLCLYILCAIDYQLVGSLEAGLKYLIVGSFGSASLLFGSALVYGATGKLGFTEIARATAVQALSGDALLVVGLAMIIAGLGFKSSSAPFHMWTPDVYEGAPTPVSAFMSAATKAAAFLLAMRVLATAFPHDARLWTWAMAGIAVASLAIGNLAALVQRDVKRMLAYSSISHAGFMLIGLSTDTALGARALMYYLIPYSAMAFGGFAVVAARERELGERVTFDTMAGFLWERPFLGVAMSAFMLGSAGMPFTGGFVGKFYAFSAAYKHGWIWLVIVGVVATIVSLSYYLGLIRAMWRPAEELRITAVAGGSPPREGPLQAAVGAALVVTIGSFFAVQPLITLARHAASALPF
ncbi:MAG: NADH-quinone oxidoreductase subunit N [Gaiellaceae bacterium]